MTDATAPQPFAGIDTDRVNDVVAAVWDHKDDMAAAARFVRDHGDDLVSALGKLPQLFASAADYLGGAAQDARAAASFLTGEAHVAGGAAGQAAAGPDPAGGGGVKSLADVAGQALERCRDELATARGMLDRLGAELEGVPIPSVTPTYSEVLGHKIVTGLDVGEGRLLASASEQIRHGAERFAGVGDELAKVAVLLRRIGGLVDQAGHGLADTAGKLEDGARSLATFAQ